ncbi:MAG: hypothetical protein IE909_00935 [Campylobacterales bacterium]|nr:hypothetical protein [Campylobacterales bacterium]
MRQLNIVLIFIATFFLSGCALINEYEDSFKLKYIHSTSKTDFSDLTYDLLEQLCPTLKEYNRKKPIYVVDFVNLEQLENHSELGFMLSDELKTHVTQMCDTPVHAIEYSKFLKLGANGTKLLSRDLDEIKNKQIKSDAYALVGTYAFTQRQLILYLKLIRLEDGMIVRSATEPTTLTDEIIHLEKKPRQSINKVIYSPFVL